jgi:hypothetical protein
MIMHSTMHLSDDLHFTWYRVITSVSPLDKFTNLRHFHPPHFRDVCARDN